MRLLINLLLLAFISFNGSLHALYCQCTSDGLQEVNCIEVVSENNPCDSKCDCKAGRVCVGGWCYGKVSNTNCMSLLGLQTFCQEAPETKCNPNILNPNCQCASGRVCSSYGYCVGKSEIVSVTVLSIVDFEDRD